MNFFKKNIILCIVLGLTFIASGTLIVMIFIGHGKMLHSMEKIDKIKAEIKKLQRQVPKPHKTNLIRIKKDIDEYQTKLTHLQNFFGQPYYNAKRSYIGALMKDMSEDKFMEMFEEFWNKNAIQGSNRHQLFMQFNRAFPPKQLSVAKDLFKAAYQKETIEKIDETNINDIIMYTLGVPRTMSPVQCILVITKIRENMLKKLQDAKVFISDEASAFTFREYINKQMPPEIEVPAIIEQFTIIGDIVQRIIKSGIKQIDRISRGNLNGTESGNFIIYKYDLTIVGKMKELRAFVNQLSEAYAHRRVYVVGNIVLKKVVDGAESILSVDKNKLSTVAVNKPDHHMDLEGGMNLHNAATTTVAAEDESKKPYYKRSDYGKAVIGGNENVEMQLSIKYIVYKRKIHTISE